MKCKNTMAIIKKKIVPRIVQLTFVASLILFAGFGCNSNQGITQSATTSGWKTYTNTSYGISIDIPKSWKIAEYTGSGDDIVSIAFDPKQVGTQADYNTLDQAMGLVTISLSTKVRPSEQFMVNKVKMGKDKIPADLLIQLCKEPECPNPWWVDRARVDYYVDLPEDKKTENFDSLRISFQYPEGTEAEDAFRLTLENIVASFEFINTK